jgi:hypothetical protein
MKTVVVTPVACVSLAVCAPALPFDGVDWPAIDCSFAP